MPAATRARGRTDSRTAHGLQPSLTPPSGRGPGRKIGALECAYPSAWTCAPSQRKAQKQTRPPRRSAAAQPMRAARSHPIACKDLANLSLTGQISVH
jgi:hypothetical protein